MKRFLKWAGITLGSLVLIILGTIGFFNWKFSSLKSKVYDISVEALTIPTDSISITKGKRWTGLCQECHGDKLEGKKFFEDPIMGHMYTSNLTSGKGGIGSYYTVEDWVRAIRHGITPKGRGLMVMPSTEYNNMSKEDMANLIAYLQTLEPVDNEIGETNINLPARVLAAAGAMGPFFVANAIDHEKPYPDVPPMANNAIYGEYMVGVMGCKSCHGEQLNGGAAHDPNSPPGSNLTPGGNLDNWSEDQFVEVFDTGITPEGKELNPSFMPWKAFGSLDEIQVRAIYKYLQALPPAEFAMK